MKGLRSRMVPSLPNGRTRYSVLVKSKYGKCSGRYFRNDIDTQEAPACGIDKG